MNGDGFLQLPEFSAMISFSNPGTSQRKITRAFQNASTSNGEHIDRERLGAILLANGFVLAERPADYTEPAAPSVQADQADAAPSGAEPVDAPGPDYRAMWGTMAKAGKMSRTLSALRKPTTPGGTAKRAETITEEAFSSEANPFLIGLDSASR